MGQLKDIGIIKIIERTLNCVDPRLVNHGKRVAYKVYRILQRATDFNQAQMRDLCITALLHDIGAYKTEDINKMLYFETQNVWDHAIFGYLFTKYFSPLNSFSPYILFHHAGCEELRHIAPAYHVLSQYIFISDRIDILSQPDIEDENVIIRHLNRERNRMFFSDIVDLVLDDLPNLLGDGYERDEEFNNMLYNSAGWSEEEVEDYLKMIIFSIDFRSHQTVSHTIATTCISKSLGELLSLPHEDRYPLAIGAWLHDLGKSGIPMDILENPNKLNDREMAVAKNHILLTNHILTGNVDDKINLIASRHHEKLDGSGYPDMLQAKALSLPERIVAVADIFSALHGARSYKEAFPKRKVIDIIWNMSRQGLLDSDVADASIEHYDAIIERINRISEKIVGIYNEMNRERCELIKMSGNIKKASYDLFSDAMQGHQHKLTRIEEW